MRNCRSGCHCWTTDGGGPTSVVAVGFAADFAGSVGAAAAAAGCGVPWGWTFPGHDRSTTGTRARTTPSWGIWDVSGPGLASGKEGIQILVLRELSRNLRN